MPRPFSDPLSASDGLEVFIPEAVIHSPAVGEFRQIVNLFIDIPIDPTNDLAVTSFMDVVFELQERYGGYFLRPEFGDKGFNLLMFWGAPIAHETDVDRALNFVLDLKSRSGLPIKAGVTYLTAYAGLIGARIREDYTAYGWGVNLAARFMKMAASGEVWIDEEAARRAEHHFEVKYRDKFEFKGFTSKQKVFTLVARKDAVDLVFHGELLGRSKELRQLSAFVKPIFHGQFAGVLVVQGEAGIGKSRLVHSFQSSDEFRENPSRWVLCQTDEILRQSLNPFMGWLYKYFSVSESQSETANLKNFNDRLQALINATSVSHLAAELERTSSVLAALLGISQQDTLYEQLDARERYENTFIALSTLLRAESLQTPLILFLEDIQWLDDDTRAFLPYFVRTVTVESDISFPIAILATRRPDGTQLQFDDVLETQFLTLDRLSANDISQLAKYVLGGPVSATLLDLLERRTEGNPFFTEQILRYLSEKKLLIQNRDGFFDCDSRAERSLPMDVGTVLISRLDSLAPEVRDVAQTASILGREFDVPLLTRMLQGDAELSKKIALAAAAEIWFPLDQMHYIFRHALLRDAAYTMQLLTRQRELHALAVSAMEALYTNELELHYGELAYHAERA
ncbi:MAG: AAA family ATPase, partial [Anaerolineales bacterium]